MIARIVKGDNMEFMRTIPDKFYGLAICDIPYGLNVGKMAYLTENKKTVKQKNGNNLNIKNKTYKNKDWDSKVPEQAYFDELKRISKHQIIFGVEYVNWQGLNTGRIRWEKGVPKGMSFKAYEMAYCSFIDYEYKLPLLWSGLCQAKSLNEPMTQQGNKKLNEKRLQPAHKPINLYKALIMFSLAELKLSTLSLCDMNGGSMSSVIACIDMELDIDCVEIDEEYYKNAVQRIKNYIGQLKLFNTKPEISYETQ